MKPRFLPLLCGLLFTDTTFSAESDPAVAKVLPSSYIIDMANPVSLQRELNGVNQVEIHIINMAPQKREAYRVTVDYHAVEVPAFEKPDFWAAMQAQGGTSAMESPGGGNKNNGGGGRVLSVCEVLLDKAGDFEQISDERNVQEGIAELRTAMARADGECVPEVMRVAERLIASTSMVVPVTLTSNQAVNVTVTVGDTEVVASLSSPGTKWISHIGLGFVLDQNEMYHSVAVDTEGGTHYVVAEQHDRKELSYTAMAMFTYPVGPVGGEIQWGFSGGLGATDNSLSALIGGSIIINKNMIVTLGVTMQEATILAGQYEVGSNLGDQPLDSEVLTDTTYKPAGAIVFGFRFGD